MSRVIAGPIATRTLGVFGADVVLLSSANLANLPLREVDTARGKRTAFLHLATQARVPIQLETLIAESDVFCQAYRPGALASKGLTPENLQRSRPGIVYAELTAFGFSGRWADRRAYDSLTQTCCGMNYLESLHYLRFQEETNAKAKREGEKVIEPRAMPVQALDYVAGSLMCFAVLASKIRGMIERIGNTGKDEEEEEEGWKVELSLASTAEWIISLGQLEGREAWEKPPEKVLPKADDEQGWREMQWMIEGYTVRGLEQKNEEQVKVLAPRSVAVEERNERREEFKWTVPAHLNVDRLEWLA